MPVTKYIWDVATDSCLMETDENDATTAVYTNEPGQFGPTISQRRNGASHFFHHDALGSVVDVTDASESLTDSYLYKAYGELLAATGSTVNPFRWVGSLGYYYDIDLLQYYIRARHYAPFLGRWLSVDPIGYRAEDTNLYRHVFNAPLSRTDPSGMVSPCYDPMDPRKPMWPGGPIPANFRWRRPSKPYCGQEIGAKLSRLRINLEAQFQKTLNNNRNNAYLACAHMEFSFAGWDITLLTYEYMKRFQCGDPWCENTVEVHGKCNWAADVNYFLWGLANRLCHDEFNPQSQSSRWLEITALLKAAVWGRAFAWPVGTGTVRGRKDWTKAGYFRRLKVTTDRPGSTKCRKCGVPYPGTVTGHFGSGGTAFDIQGVSNVNLP